MLRELGFDRVDARNGWRWLDKVVWVFNIRAVGSYFSDMTGWPPGSVGVWLGVYYTIMPADRSIKADDSGRLLPAEHICHMRTHLDCGLDQAEQKARLENPAERKRTDLWWIERDGSNAASVASDIAQSLNRVGAPWFSRLSDLPTALREIEKERDCLMKFDRAALLARELGDEGRWRRYAALAIAQGVRVDPTYYRAERYGV